jgi:hypothetical protein
MKNTLLILVAGFMLLDIARPSTGGHGGGCNGANVGKVTGSVNFSGLNCQPEQPDFNVPPCSGPYPNYKIEVYLENGTSLALTAMTNSKGQYSIELPSGDYVIYTQNGPMEKNRESHPVHIQKGSTVALDLRVSTGIL